MERGTAVDVMRGTQSTPESLAYRPSKLRSWLQLFRLPNLITAPGDSVAGFLLANTGTVAMFPGLLLVALASLCFYTGGLVFNDLADREEDAAERPERPLPSFKITPRQALMAGCGLFCAGLVFCALVGSQTFWLGLCLCALIQTYNLGVKNVAVVGPVVMGVCRGISVLLGASAARESASMGQGAWVAAVIIMGFVASITHLSRRETSPIPPTAEAWVPLGVLALGLTLLTSQFDHIDMVRRIGLIVPYLAACGVTLYVALRVTSKGHFEDIGFEIQKQEELIQELPELVGTLIGALLFLQAAFIFASGKGMLSFVLGSIAVMAWTLNRNLRRYFYAS